MYMTLKDFFEGVDCGAYGPDEDCRWVCIDEEGNLVEEPVKHPRISPTLPAIAVVYYAA